MFIFVWSHDFHHALEKFIIIPIIKCFYRPQYGGKACLGEDKVFKMCNVIDCPVDADDFHTAQCATYNKQPFQGWYLQWKPQKLYNNGKYESMCNQ